MKKRSSWMWLEMSWSGFENFLLRYKMPTVYHPFKVALSEDQRHSLAKAVKEKAAVTLRVKPEQIGKGDDLPLTTTLINRLKEASSAGPQKDITFSKTQIG